MRGSIEGMPDREREWELTLSQLKSMIRDKRLRLKLKQFEIDEIESAITEADAELSRNHRLSQTTAEWIDRLARKCKEALKQ